MVEEEVVVEKEVEEGVDLDQKIMQIMSKETKKLLVKFLKALSSIMNKSQKTKVQDQEQGNLKKHTLLIISNLKNLDKRSINQKRKPRT